MLEINTAGSGGLHWNGTAERLEDILPVEIDNRAYLKHLSFWGDGVVGAIPSSLISKILQILE